MAASPVKFLFGFLMISITLWMVFIFASRLLAWILSRIVGASVGFRVAGWKCLRDVVVKFNKGAIESILVGEIKLSLRQSLVKLGFGIISKDPKLQVLICDLEIVLRPSTKSSQKSKSRKPRTSGRGKWMVVANIARFLSVSITDLVLKTPKATVEVKELKVDISKDGGSKPNLFVKLHILPISVHAIRSLSGIMEKFSAPFSCEEFSLSCEFGHDREAGVVVRNVDINCGEVVVNLNEELLSKNKKSSDVFSETDRVTGLTADSVTKKKPQKKQAAILALTKYTSVFPEKICFNLPKLDVKFVHREHDLFVENNIMGIQLKSIKSRSTEDVGESTRLDVQLEFSEIHLLREAGSSILEIMKVDVVSFVYIPIQVSPLQSWQVGVFVKLLPLTLSVLYNRASISQLVNGSPIQLVELAGGCRASISQLVNGSPIQLPISLVRAEVDVKLGGTQCNIIMSILKPWLGLQSSKKKGMVLREETSTIEKPQSSESKAFMWTCTVSAPEMTIVLYSISGVPLYHGCSQSSHVFANNISSTGTTVHMELGELNLHMADEYQECLKESLFSVESNSGSLLHIAKVSLDWGKKDMESSEDDGPRCKLVLSTDVTGMGIYLTFKRVESLIIAAMSFQALLKNLSAGKKATQSRTGRSSKPSGKGTRLLKFNLERCSVSFCGETSLDNTVVADPKRVNYGSQGGRVVISVSADGTPRNANLMSTASDQCKKLKYSLLLDIFHFSLCVNKEKQSTQVELERARSIYQEHLEEDKPDTKVALFDMQNAKFVRRSGGLKEIAVCSLFSATDISIRWEPDVHLSLFELVLQLKALVHNQKVKGHGNELMDNVSGVRDAEQKKEVIVMESGHLDKTKKKESIFAVDVEMLSISAEAGDGVDALVQVQSIFSENARIGVLLEGLMLSFNGARIFKSSRMQISRIPNASSSSDAAVPVGTVWDWVVQALDVHICMPFRLQLRAIDDAVEEMLRALKLITSAKTQLILPMKKESSKPKKPSSTKFGRVKFCIRKLTADIEEEPIQGWLDEHYHLMKNEAVELAVRLKFLNDFILANQCPKTAEISDSACERKIQNNGVEINVQDPSAIEKMQEEICKQSFQSYYLACQKLKPSEGSGACREGFQAGFKPSTARTSLLSVSATDLDVTLTRIDGGDDGMIKVLRQLDPVCRESNIPFSRLYGSNILLNTGSLTVQLRNYTLPLFSAISGRCEGRVVLAQQATCFQPQISNDVFIGRWRKVRMLRSASGTTPPMKTYSDLPIHFEKAEVSFGVGYEPVFADISYAFTVALRRANLSNRSPGLPQPPKKERSLPWWDDMRNYIHGNITLFFSETKWNILATTDPYERLDKLQIVSGSMEIQQSDGRVYVSAKDFKIFLSSLESLVNSHSLKLPASVSGAFLEAPVFSLEVTMDWECESGNPMNHYLFALPIEGKPREKVFDPFRSTSLSLRWNFSLKPLFPALEKQSPSASVSECTVLEGTVNGAHFKDENVSIASPTVNVGAHDLAWIVKFWNMNYIPPHKLRSFSRWPRFGIPRIPRSGNLSLDRVMTEFMLRLDATPTCIKHKTLDDDDPAKGLAFGMTKLKYEICYSRGKQKYTFECKRDPLDLVYQGLDLHMPKVFLNKEDCNSVTKVVQMTRKTSQSASIERVPSEKNNYMSGCTEKHRDEGFLLSSDYFTIRRQAPKADPARLFAWQEAGRKNLEMTYVRSEFENGSESDEHARSDPSDDDGYNVVIADNCQRVFVYGLKLLWTIENRDAVWSFVGGISKAFEPQKPSPSRQYAQRKLLEEYQKHGDPEMPQEDTSKSPSSNHGVASPSQHVETSGSHSSLSHAVGMENLSTSAVALNDSEEEGTRHFMVNVIEPQFNLHSEDANGRFLLAAVSGRVLARSFHSVLHVGYEMIEQALGTGNVHIPEGGHDMTLKRTEFSVMLEHVQAHVAPTDVDPGAGLQWLPKIRRSSTKVKRTGALLERVFLPCDMYFRYTRHKGGTPDLKVKPLKDLTFNSHNITATMTSRQFQVMLDVLTNLLFARLPKPRKSSLSCPGEDDEDVGEEADEVVPDGVEEVELAKISLEQKEREQKLLLNDIKKLSLHCDTSGDHLEKEGDWWMVNGGRSILLLLGTPFLSEPISKVFSQLVIPITQKCGIIKARKGDADFYYSVDLAFLKKCTLDLKRMFVELQTLIIGIRVKLDKVQGMKRELVNAKKSRKAASVSLRVALQKAAQLRLMEKEKNKSPSYAMRISLQINKVVWSMLVDGKSFAEAEINDMIYDFDRDYKDVGVAQFTTKYFVVRNCLLNAKSDMLLSAWNPPPEWGKYTLFPCLCCFVMPLEPHLVFASILRSTGFAPNVYDTFLLNVMLRVDAKQGAPKDANSPLELFQVEIYPLKIHLTETMYRMMWEYFFPEEEQDSQRRQEVWKVSTTAGARRVKKGFSTHDASASGSHSTKESEISSKPSVSTTSVTSQPVPADSAQVSILMFPYLVVVMATY
ncbi:FMP27/BLTP2/Hobbit [Theobroma cacao]|nr:FMP27/BLTP2/Hobbit [Theobroma cacao]